MKNRNKVEKILIYGALVAGAISAVVILIFSIRYTNPDISPIVGIAGNLMRLCIIAMPLMLLYHKGNKLYFTLFTFVAILGLIFPSFMVSISYEAISISAFPMMSLIGYAVIGSCSVRMSDSSAKNLALVSAMAAGVLALKSVIDIFSAKEAARNALGLSFDKSKIDYAIGIYAYNKSLIYISICNVIFFAAIAVLFVVIMFRLQRWYCSCGFRNAPHEKFCGGCGKPH